MSDHITINQHNQLTLPDGSQVSIYGIDQRIKQVGYTPSPLTRQAEELRKACSSALLALQRRLRDNRSLAPVDELSCKNLARVLKEIADEEEGLE